MPQSQPSTNSSPPVVLSVAGSDCSAGAGIQADLKTFSTHRSYGLTAVTSVVAETPHEVVSVHVVPPQVLSEQLDLLLSSYPVAAMKTGLLPSPEHIAVVAESNLPPFLVVDPVSVASTGDALGRGDLIAAFSDLLLPRACLVTPNLGEANALLGRSITSREDVPAAAAEIAHRFGCPVLLKGGHFEDAGGPDDYLHQNDASAQWIKGDRIDATDVSHGTGCTLSAAITANLAHGCDVLSAVTRAKSYLTKALAEGIRWHQPGKPTIGGLRHHS